MTNHRIATSYDLVTPESAEEGDIAESGWVDEEGESMDGDEDVTPVEAAIAFLRRLGVYPSASCFYAGCVWYIGQPDLDFRTGAEETRSYFPRGYTDAEAEEIFHAIQATP
jgi:hypothetical protein